MVPAVSLMIHHFDLFGTRQVWLYLRGQEYTALPFRTPMLYAQMRHPLYVGWATAFWATPTMTLGHFLFAAGMTGYMLLAVVFEERDLVAHFGNEYEEYRNKVPMFVPRMGAERPEIVAEADAPVATNSGVTCVPKTWRGDLRRN
jgi:protein-S-isoprenylcysteine O-methyltransferase Ste14